MRQSWIVLPIVLAVSVAPHAQRSAVRLRVADANSGLPLRAQITAASTVPLPRTFSDEHGEATVDVGSAARTVRVSKPGYIPQPVELAPGDEVIPIRLVRGGAISGRVIDMLGAPVVNRPILIGRQTDSRQPPRIARTDDLGAYRVGTLPDGAYTVTLGVATLVAPVTNAPPPLASPDAVPHIVVVRRGDDVGGIDFVVPPRVTCPSPVSADQDVNTPLGRRAVDVRSSASIAGRVTTADGRPLPCVEVAALRGGGPVAAGLTDANGSYVLERLAAGAYAIEFKRAGFVVMQWGQSDSGPPGRQLTIRERERVNRIDIKLPKGGAVTGSVVDEFGEPVEDVIVRALHVLDQGDRAMAINAGTVQTDDRGRYRVFGLLPGRYIVGSTASTEGPDPRIGTGYAPAYYPGTVEIASAVAVDVQGDAERQWVDFARVPTRVATISGTAVNSRSERVTDRVMLVASQRSGAVIAETQGADVKGADGVFTIPNVPPGDYVLQTTSKRGDEPPEFAMQYVTVFENDPLPVRIQTRAGVGLQGRLIEEGVPQVDPRAFTLEAVPVDWDQTSLLAPVPRITPDAEGLLALSGITGPRRFVLTSSRSDWYLKSVRIRGGDVTDDVMGFPLGGFTFIRDLEVVVSNKGATVEGDVLDGSTLATQSSVVLFSTNPDHWFRGSRFVKTVRGNVAGGFRIEGAADGEYFIVATDPLDGAAGVSWQQRDFLQSIVAGARRVRLREQEGRTVTLTVVHR